MMINVKNFIDFASLSQEVRDLIEIEWGSVWEGPPQPGTPEFSEWCNAGKWKSLTVEHDLEAETRHGNIIDFQARGLWRPVVSARMSLLHISATEPHEKNEVIAQAVGAWGEYVRACSTSLGEPNWKGGGEVEGFPDPPYEDAWWKPRNVNGNPYRMAYWEPRNREKRQPYVILTQSLSRTTWQVAGGAGANVTIEFVPPFPVKK